MDQMKTTITMLRNVTLSFIELYVHAKKYNMEVGDLFNRACIELQQVFQQPKPCGTPTNEPTNTSPPQTSKGQDDSFYASDELLKAFEEFENSLTKSKNLKDESIQNFDLGIDDDGKQQHDPINEDKKPEDLSNR